MRKWIKFYFLVIILFTDFHLILLLLIHENFINCWINDAKLNFDETSSIRFSPVQKVSSFSETLIIPNLHYYTAHLAAFNFPVAGLLYSAI